MVFEKYNSKNNEKEVKDFINKNIASSMKTQRQFSLLLIFNGCSKMKVGHIGSKIRKQLLREAKNGDLTVDDVMPRAYSLIGEVLGISDVKTLEDMAIENPSQEYASQKEITRKTNKKKMEIENKFGIDLTNKIWFQCSIEEVKYSTFTNQPQRNIDTAYVIINEDNFEIIKESVWLKTNMGTRKLFFDNITSMDYDARGLLHASSSIIINTKGAEHVQLKFVTKDNFDLMNNAFESYLEKTHKPQQTAPIQQNVSTTTAADELLKYAQLYEKGLLTKEEFETKKQQLLNDETVSLKEEYMAENEIELTPKFCPNCGNPIEEGSKFCSSCGNKLL